jgi:transaldolase
MMRQSSILVGDTADMTQVPTLVNHYGIREVTTNPTLITMAVEQGRYPGQMGEAIDRAMRHHRARPSRLTWAALYLTAAIGREILQVIPGRISTELDARLAFDPQGSYSEAQRLMEIYHSLGIDSERILVKLPATWEGLEAAGQLERQGIHCNLTLIFHLEQAARAADQGVSVVSPFVGRISDWYFNKRGLRPPDPDHDPGVQSVRMIHGYMKSHGYATQTMAASFRSTSQITALAGCDLLTLPPALLEALAQEEVGAGQSPAWEGDPPRAERLAHDEATFRYVLNDDPMASDLLADGIRRFAKDGERLLACLDQAMPA